MSDLSIETTGETVGEAKWAALRELEQRRPGLDRSAVQFEVLSEGERGLLGVGYAPARVLATLPEGAATAEPRDESALAVDARSLVSRIVAALDVDAGIEVRETDDAVTITCSGPDLALLIGRHGQTIDAIQYLLNAIAYREHGGEHKDLVVDAAGYRERRRSVVESLAVHAAQRVLDTGEPEELEPMTSVERKIAHLRLKELAGVTTSSEGTEPNRYVVVLPEP